MIAPSSNGEQNLGGSIVSAWQFLAWSRIPAGSPPERTRSGNQSYDLPPVYWKGIL